MATTLALTGATSAEVSQIAKSLRQNPLAQLRDANGNYRILNGKWIKFDANNRPIRIITSDGTKTDLAYTYDGARVKKTVTPPSGPAVTTHYIGDIYEQTGGQSTAHIFAGSQRIAAKTGATVLYFHQDHLGSTNFITNSAGAVVQTTEYQPLGASWSTSGSLTGINFTGHRLDASDGLIFMKARYYDPAMGRFVTPDSIVQSPYDPQSLNRYAYCRNNPVNLVDPSGHSFGLNRTLHAAGDVAKKVFTAYFGLTNPAAMINMGIHSGSIHNWNDGFRYSYQGMNWAGAAAVAYAGGAYVGNNWGTIFPGGTNYEIAGFFNGVKFASFGTGGINILGWGAGIGAGISIGYNLWPNEHNDGGGGGDPDGQLYADAGDTGMGVYDAVTWISGTQAGEESAEWYADQYVATGNPLYAVGGGVASLWTPDTAVRTALTLTVAYSVSGWAARTGPGLIVEGPSTGTRIFQIRDLGSGKPIFRFDYGPIPGGGVRPHYHRGPDLGLHRPWEGW